MQKGPARKKPVAIAMIRANDKAQRLAMALTAFTMAALTGILLHHLF